MLLSLAPAIVEDSLADQQAKSDLAEINHMVYGIFNVNSWKAKIAEIVYDEISKIDLKATAGKLKTTVENQLSAVIDRLNQQVQEANQGTWGGKLKQVMINLEAKITEMSFVLVGHQVLFENQVLYFQSKSILDVFLPASEAPGGRRFGAGECQCLAS